MNAGGAGLLGDPHDGVLDVARCGHHQVCEFVDDGHDVRVGLVDPLTAQRGRDLAGTHLLVEHVDMADPGRLHVLVALFHLLDQPRQRRRGFLGLGDDRRDEMGNPFVRRQLDHLGVDQDHPDLVRRSPRQQRHQHGIDETGLTRTSRARHQQVRHLGQVRRDEIALDVLAQADDQRVMVAPGLRCRQHVGQPHHLAVGVGHLDAHRRLAGDRGQHAHALSGDGIGDVAVQCGDLLDLHSRAEFDFVARDRGAAGAARDRRVDLELVEHRGDGVGHVLIGRTVALRRIACDEQVERRQAIGTFDNPVERLGAALPGFPTRVGAPLLLVPAWRDGLGAGRRSGRLGGLAGVLDGVLDWIIVLGRARPRRCFVEVARRVVVIAVGEILDPRRTREALLLGSLVAVVTLTVGVVGAMAVSAPAEPGGRHGLHGRDDFTDRGPGHQQHPEDRADEQQRHGDPRGKSVGERPADDETGEARPVLTGGRGLRRAGPHMPQSQNGQRDHRAPKNQARTRLRVRFGAHERHRDHGQDHRQDHHPGPDDRTQGSVDPRPDRPGRVEP